MTMEQAEELMKRLLEKSDEERVAQQAYKLRVEELEKERAGIYASAQALPPNPMVTEYVSAVKGLRFDGMSRTQKETKVVRVFQAVFSSFGKSKTVVVYDSAKEGCDWFWSAEGMPKVTVMSGGGFGIVERKISTKVSCIAELRFIAAHRAKIARNMRALKFNVQADLLELFFDSVPSFLHGAEFSGGFVKVEGSTKRLFVSRGTSGVLRGVLFSGYGRVKLAVQPDRGKYQLAYTTVGTDVLNDGLGYLLLLAALPEIMASVDIARENERLWTAYDPATLRIHFGKYLLMEAI